MDLAKAILNIREENNLTQDDFAAKLHVTRQAVSRWENGETTPKIDTLKQIAEAFKADVCKMVGRACQSCSWELTEVDVLGFHEDGTANMDYCGHCYNAGKFSPEKNVSEMVEALLQALDMYNEAKGTSYTPEEARVILNEHLATLKRWKK